MWNHVDAILLIFRDMLIDFFYLTGKVLAIVLVIEQTILNTAEFVLDANQLLLILFNKWNLGLLRVMAAFQRILLDARVLVKVSGTIKLCHLRHF